MYIKKQGKINYWNQSCIGNFIHIEDIDFPNFSQTKLIFPIPWAPAPFPKRGVRALVYCIKLEESFSAYRVKVA